MPKWQKSHLYIHKALITLGNVDNRGNLKSPWRSVAVCSVDWQWHSEGEMNNEEHQFPPTIPWEHASDFTLAHPNCLLIKSAVFTSCKRCLSLSLSRSLALSLNNNA
ncbi:unnamed protein product [Boreogadus saida]